MAQYNTRKVTAKGKTATLAKRQARANKYGTVNLTRSGHIRTAQSPNTFEVR